MHLNYRADIDGLRAVAVMVVILFHANIPLFSGGFVGVDVFFVISGYLITSTILKEIRAGKFTIERFYERRIRRIFPALFPVIFFTLIVEFFLFDNFSFKAFGESVIATTLFASNILFWRESGYFDAASITKPLLHTWSLAVEEQFYIFFPLLLIAINRFGRSRYSKYLILLGLVSLIISIYGVYSHQVPTFYLVPSRAWELIAGSVLALEVIPVLKTNFQRNIFSIVGLGLIIYSVLFFSEATLFPGANAIFPVFGASLIIYCGLGGGVCLISRILSVKPIVYTGLISYSLYLWHWPLIVFAKYLIVRDLTSLEITGIILTTFFISALSLKFIEQPFRSTQPLIADRRKLFLISVLVMCSASFFGVMIYFQNGMPYRYPEASAAIMRIRDNPWDKLMENDIKNSNNGKTFAQVGVLKSTPSFILWGDSHANALVPGIIAQANQNGLSGFLATKSSNPPILGVDGIYSNMSVFCNHTFNDKVILFITSHSEIKTVILAAAWESYTNGYNYKGDVTKPFSLIDVIDCSSIKTPHTNFTNLENGLGRTVDAISKLNRNVIIVSDVPDLGYDLVRLYWLEKIIGLNFQGYFPSMVEYRKRNAKAYSIFRKLTFRNNVSFIFPESIIFNKNGKLSTVYNGNLLYRDSHHLSKYGSNYISKVFNNVFHEMSDKNFLNK